MAHLFPVLPEFAAKARYNAERYRADYAESVNDPNGFWKRIAGRLDWHTAPTEIQDVSFNAEDFRIRWYADGELNVSVNCLDRHLATRGDKTAILLEGDNPAEHEHVTYRDLYERTCRGRRRRDAPLGPTARGGHTPGPPWDISAKVNGRGVRTGAHRISSCRHRV